MAGPASSAFRPSEPSHAEPARGAPPAPAARVAAEVIAVTSRDDFLLELGEAIAGQAAVRPVESVGAALEHLTDARHTRLLVLDSRDSADVRAEIDLLGGRAPHALALVFAETGAEKQTASAVKGPNVFAVLPVPIDVRKTAAVFEGALAEAAQRRPEARQAAPPSTPPAPSAAPIVVEPLSQTPGPAAPAEREPPADRRTLLIAAAVVVALAVAGGAWLTMRDQSPAASSAGASGAGTTVAADDAPTAEDLALVTPQIADSALLEGSLDELLEKARLAMRARRYAEPAGDNALLYYRSAAAADPANGEALDGLSRVGAVLATRFEEALSAGQLDDAAMALTQWKSAVPAEPRLKDGDMRLTVALVNKALADGQIDRAAALVRVAQQAGAVPADQIAKWRTDIGRRQDEARLRGLLAAAGDRIREGRLLEPANDSAKRYVQELRELAPSSAAVQRIVRDLGTAYVRRARESGAANRTEAERLLAEARALGVSAADIAAVQREIANARQRAATSEGDRLAQLARERLRDGRLTEPAQDSAAHQLTLLQAADSDHAALAPLGRELATRLVERASAAARAARVAQAEADLALARRWGAEAREIEPVQQLLAASRASAARQPASLQSRLKRTRYLQPQYPQRALDRGISGTVEIEYLVDTDGVPRNLQVVSADPPEVFDRAALAAIRRWRYEPVIDDGVPVEVPTRAVIRFEAPK